MTRTKGAKNKPKSTAELINQLRDRGVNIPDDVVTPETEKEPKKEIVSAQSAGVQREQFKIKQNTPETAAADKKVYRCGVKICNIILSGPVDTCPNCGVHLDWPGES